MKDKKDKKKPDTDNIPCDLCFGEGGAYGPCRQCGRQAGDEQ